MLCYLTAMFIDKKLSGPQTDASNTTKNFVLVVFSLLFYACGEPVYVFLMLFCVLMNYFVGRGIEHFDGGKRKAMLVVGLVVNISILGTFKYLGSGLLRLCAQRYGRAGGSAQDSPSYRNQLLYVPVNLLSH